MTPEHRLQVQGLSEEDYDKVYRAGYRDGFERAESRYKGPYSEISLTAHYNDKIIEVHTDSYSEAVIMTKTFLYNMIYSAMQGEYRYVFEGDSWETT